MPQEILINDIECPHCDRDTYCDDAEVTVSRYSRQKTEMTCDECGKKFYIITDLSVSVIGT